MHRQPLLGVLRALQPLSLVERVSQLNTLGLRHVEIGFSAHPAWSEQCRELQLRFPEVSFGAASVRSAEALARVAEAGLGYAMAPVLEPTLIAQARDLGILLVPGVMTPTEVHQASALGCALVKLFPAVNLGPSYWRSLSVPMGGMVPFCIAAGGLNVADVADWLRQGVDAVVLGQGLFAASLEPLAAEPMIDPQLGAVLRQLEAAHKPPKGEKIPH
ncbi:bifunctional 4-hydroxy-2-oxoglutarate aldolase/2-dehydro-3-deoxy-phosphogluconate aldolase [Cyanobium sp. Morenito 9A2]|uniref:bifunctional 4-hydroxy-2-oxoglutarate aldolase/2-dehydro-3-deoxy-phosphogluconate aldolase n=1 Tax=Cyanobium sp. Morenito 9A2 TaxID=2823718 RepID=UPI0020CE8EE9|nr:bifunctional 4-hydroxy-2-oxoglutarate aldolase/2-dehydro-3-deoxy-phosphogluconate aldolase [Cyanobium sp. Morenito 9A2]MCP9849688.1 bifunctional 4-hydroxy-2-oxoglutarate aldolase/2-dehydro-3-deoxy-phosphogluconate aldolase [Cyanobium sp. Morenito 9A2]